MHASGVALEKSAVAFVGRTGSGKSTMAAIFHARGHDVIADDLIAVEVGREGAPAVYPGVPQLQLLPDAASFLRWRPAANHPLGIGKGTHRVIPCSPSVPLPLRCIYVLTGGMTRFRSLVHPREAVVELVRNSRGTKALNVITRGILSHFRQCVTLAGRVPVFLLKRPSSLDELSDVAELIEEDFCESSKFEDSPCGSGTELNAAAD